MTYLYIYIIQFIDKFPKRIAPHRIIFVDVVFGDINAVVLSVLLINKGFVGVIDVYMCYMQTCKIYKPNYMLQNISNISCSHILFYIFIYI